MLFSDLVVLAGVIGTLAGVVATLAACTTAGRTKVALVSLAILLALLAALVLLVAFTGKTSSHATMWIKEKPRLAAVASRHINTRGPTRH
ncbi:hypothetical protein [Actinoplanes sp. NPDC051851]|uniref:hypothetical protein n=1 Tax=Actinoplanes sp. NPDC051851 TaxID=3154753 RepID=UPI00341A1AEC